MFNRDVIPADITGVRSAEFRSNDQTGALEPVHATPASTKGVISSGGNIDSISPSPRAPNTGILNSMLATASRLPSSRSNCGQALLPSEPGPTWQSAASNESYA